MHYVPGTPWYDGIGSELELELAAGNVSSTASVAPPETTFRPVLALAWLLGVEFALASIFAWLN